jgi:hypothetical protein
MVASGNDRSSADVEPAVHVGGNTAIACPSTSDGLEQQLSG